jgi:hypothetical protein
VKESQALAEHLRFVIDLDPEPLPRMHASEPQLQFDQKVLAHLATSRKDLSFLPS